MVARKLTNKDPIHFKLFSSVEAFKADNVLFQGEGITLKGIETIYRLFGLTLQLKKTKIEPKRKS